MSWYTIFPVARVDGAEPGLQSPELRSLGYIDFSISLSNQNELTVN